MLAARASPSCCCTTSCGSSCRHQAPTGCRQLCRHPVVPTTSRSLVSMTVTSSQTGNKHTQDSTCVVPASHHCVVDTTAGTS